VAQVAQLPNPLGEVIDETRRPNGLVLQRVRVPLGVIGIIYESRPNVTADAAALCLRAGNAAILRGGSEAIESNRAIHAAMIEGIGAAGLPVNAIQLVPTTDRAAVGAMLRAAGLIDLIVPRGGKSLVARVQEEARVPVLAHLDGMNTSYVHASADPGDGARADPQRQDAPHRHLRRDRDGAARCRLPREARGDRGACSMPNARCAAMPAVQALDSRVTPASDEDWDTEYLDAIVAAAEVNGLDEALAHIAAHSPATIPTRSSPRMRWPPNASSTRSTARS
jgi:glutamate-5-semialdehyde dehydrogenase